MNDTVVLVSYAKVDICLSHLVSPVTAQNDAVAREVTVTSVTRVAQESYKQRPSRHMTSHNLRSGAVQMKGSLRIMKAYHEIQSALLGLNLP